MGTARLGESTAQARCLLPALPSPPGPCLSRAGSGLGGTCRRRGPGGEQRPLGFIQVAFSSHPVRGGAHSTKRSTHRAPNSDITPVSTVSFGVYEAGRTCSASAPLSTRLLVSGCYWYAARYQSFRSPMENAGCAHGVNLGPQDSEPCGYTQNKRGTE